MKMLWRAISLFGLRKLIYFTLKYFKSHEQRNTILNKACLHAVQM